MSFFLPWTSGPMGRPPEGRRPCYRASVPAHRGWDRAYPWSFPPMDWQVSPRRGQKTQERQSPPRLSRGTSCYPPTSQKTDEPLAGSARNGKTNRLGALSDPSPVRMTATDRAIGLAAALRALASQDMMIE